MPLFTVIIPFHNSATTLAATLSSLQAQSVQDWHAICIDDGGQDQSRTIAEGFAAADSRLTVIDNTGHGPSDARNLGAGQATGRYIAFLDSDDLWAEHKLQALTDAFAKSDADAIYARVGFFQDTPQDCQALSTILMRPVQINDFLAENPVCTLSNLTLKASVFRKIGGFDRSIVHNEDLEFLIRVVGTGHTVQGLDDVLTFYRANATGLSSQIQAMLDSRARVVETARTYGVCPTRGDDAVYMRYLARRALRLDAPKGEAWRYARAGLRLHPRRFLTPFKRGAATAGAAALVRCIPSVSRLIRS